MADGDGPSRALRRRGVLLACVVLVGAASLAPPAGATNFSGATGSTTCLALNRADNATHTFFYSDVASTTRTSLTSTRTNVYNPTAVTTSLVSSPTRTTDVVVYDGDYRTYCGLPWDGPEGNVVGHTRCVSTNTADECEKHEARFDSPDMAGKTPSERNHFTCHEIGHSLGLAHRTSSPNGCMTDQSNVPTDVTAHDEGHLGNDLSSNDMVDDVEG